MITCETLNRYRPHALGVLRIVAALLLLEHGTAKLLGFPATEMNPPVMSIYWIAGLIELVFGALLVLGLFTRLSAFIASGLCAFAYFLGHASASFFPILNGGDAAILFCFVFLYIVFAGPGRFALGKEDGLV